MKELLAYLNFDGNAREAMQFYEKCLGGKLQMMTFCDAQIPNLPLEPRTGSSMRRSPRGLSR